MNKGFENDINFFKSIELDEHGLLKARGLPPGTIREWGGRKYKKQANGKWMVQGGVSTKQTEKAVEQKKKPEKKEEGDKIKLGVVTIETKDSQGKDIYNTAVDSINANNKAMNKINESVSGGNVEVSKTKTGYKVKRMNDEGKTSHTILLDDNYKVKEVKKGGGSWSVESSK